MLLNVRRHVLWQLDRNMPFADDMCGGPTCSSAERTNLANLHRHGVHYAWAAVLSRENNTMQVRDVLCRRPCTKPGLAAYQSVDVRIGVSWYDLGNLGLLFGRKANLAANKHLGSVQPLNEWREQS